MLFEGLESPCSAFMMRSLTWLRILFPSLESSHSALLAPWTRLMNWRPGSQGETESERENWGSGEQSAKPQRTPRRQKLSLESSPRAKSSLCIWAPASNEWYLFDPLNYVVPEENKIVCCDWVDLMLKPEVMDGCRSEKRAANLMIIDRRQPLYGRSLVTSTLVVLIELQDVVFHPATMLQHYSA